MTQIINIKNERVGITTCPTDIKIIIREYYEHLNDNIFHNLYEMDKFSKIH